MQSVPVLCAEPSRRAPVAFAVAGGRQRVAREHDDELGLMGLTVAAAGHVYLPAGSYCELTA